MITSYTIIVNPIAGKGYAARKLPAIEKFMEKNKLDYDIILTRHPGHAITLSEEHGRKKSNAVIAAGGDGTCNEVINGLMLSHKHGRHKACFGVLPLGRGNDFAHGAGIPPKFEEALEVVKNQNINPIDIGLVTGGYFPEGRYFCNGIGVGFDTIVGLRAAKLKHVHGAAAYVIGALQTFIKYPVPPEIMIKHDNDSITLYTAQISIMNGSRMGGIFHMAPNADNKDGLLDLCISSKITRRQAVRALINYTKGTQDKLDYILTERTGSIQLVAVKGGMAVHADGETVCIEGKKLQIDCLPSALNVITGTSIK